MSACARSAGSDASPASGGTLPTGPSAEATDASPADTGAPVGADGGADAGRERAPERPTILPRASIDGPHELLLAPGRPIFFAFAKADAGAPPSRLVAHLHGMCGPPSYACGTWLGAGTAIGALVCPTGNARCGDSPVGPPSWDAATWPELLRVMDTDLESAIAKVGARRPGALVREGAILTGYSRGAYAAVPIALRHPGRWPYLVLVEADAPVDATALRKAGVRAVAFVGGELGDQIKGQRGSVEKLEKAGFPARLFVMKKTGHLYSADMEEVMRDALAFVLAHEPG